MRNPSGSNGKNMIYCIPCCVINRHELYKCDPLWSSLQKSAGVSVRYPVLHISFVRFWCPTFQSTRLAWMTRPVSGGTAAWLQANTMAIQPNHWGYWATIKAIKPPNAMCVTKAIEPLLRLLSHLALLRHQDYSVITKAIKPVIVDHLVHEYQQQVLWVERKRKDLPTTDIPKMIDLPYST